MIDRYAFHAQEEHCHALWVGRVFSKDVFRTLKDALTADILSRQKEPSLFVGKADLLLFGILASGPQDEREIRQAMLYGADAWRTAQILEKKADNLRPYWKLMQKWYLLFGKVSQENTNVITMELLKFPETALLAKSAMTEDLYHIVTIIRRLLKKELSDSSIYFLGCLLAPFVPHLLVNFLIDSPKAYDSLRLLNDKYRSFGKEP